MDGIPSSQEDKWGPFSLQKDGGGYLQLSRSYKGLHPDLKRLKNEVLSLQEDKEG